MPSGQVLALETALRNGLCLKGLDEGFSLEDLLPELGRLELNALGRVKRGNVLRGDV
jgi:hypothetical protein